ncbi:MAG: gamma-glutamyltransferase [Flavobacteriaceae bacterium]|nr:gamma-glutamyltransferase [Flavobacteriaceae bacterium]
MINSYKVYLLLFLLIVNSCESFIKRPVKAAVVSARKEASDIGIEIMSKGGNAFDAMIATGLALSVCYPNAGNIAGGGFLVYRTYDGKYGSLDYREKAPLLANRDMYLDSIGNILPEKSTLGGLAIGVPGTVAGLFEVHKKFGSLSWETLVEPSIRLAKIGYTVTKKQKKSFDSNRDKFIEINGKNTFYGKNFKIGDKISNLEYANTLELIKKYGKSGFYEGINAERFINSVKQSGGIISKDDLLAYSPVWRDPIQFKYKDLLITSMSPPSSGGVCLGQLFKMIEPYNIGQYNHNSSESIQLMVEAERRSYADRSEFLGDPDFFDVPTNQLLDSIYLINRMSDFNWNQASLSTDIKYGELSIRESDETTHYSIIDKYGNAISVTTTLNGSYGSKVYVEDGGYFLNNEMDDFSSKPGSPNMFGLLGNEANSIHPEKRMLSSMTPTIVEKNKKLYLILGSPGGSKIITSVFQTIINTYEFKMNIQQAVSSSRFHHQWMPDEIIFEPNKFSDYLIDDLKSKGYLINLDKSTSIGRVDAIMVDENGFITCGADPRGDDFASYFRQ